MQSKRTQWHNHINHIRAPDSLRHWLTGTGSLTAKLIAHSSAFRVQRLFQQRDLCWADEYAQIGLSNVKKVHAREVILRCDDVPTVYAHTVLPFQSNANQWPLFKSLGEKSLGSTLFSDPQVKRGALQFARLRVNHPAMRRIRQLTLHDDIHQPLFARRSLFYRRGGIMLVTELFLPGVLALSRKLSHL